MARILTRAQAYEESENIGRNPTDNPTLGDIIATRYGRRDILKRALGVAAISATVSPLALIAATKVKPALPAAGKHFVLPSLDQVIIKLVILYVVLIVIAGLLKKHSDSLLREPASLELRQDHPADLGNRLTATFIVGPQRDRPCHRFLCGLAGDDHLDPRVVRRGLLDVVSHLLLEAFAGPRTAQLGHHHWVASHPHIGADVA